jgi:hypothetical protein
MKCPVSMLPTSSDSSAAIIFVIGLIVLISYSARANAKPAATPQGKN